MRVAAVWLPHFAALLETTREAELVGKPVIISHGEQAQVVFDCSSAAEALGVRVGTPLR